MRMAFVHVFVSVLYLLLAGITGITGITFAHIDARL
jgi:hypothetical protein